MASIVDSCAHRVRTANLLLAALLVAATCPPGFAATAQDTGYALRDNDLVRIGSDGSITTILPGLSGPMGIDVDVAGTTAYVVENRSGELTAIDLATRRLTRVAHGLSDPKVLALGPVTGAAPPDRAYVIESYQDPTGYLQRLTRVELATGELTTVISGLQLGVGLAITADGSTAYATAFEWPDLYGAVTIDLATGAIALVPSGGLGTGNSGALALDESRHRLFVVSTLGWELIDMIDLQTGTRVPVNVTVPQLNAIDCDPARNRVAISSWTGAYVYELAADITIDQGFQYLDAAQVVSGSPNFDLSFQTDIVTGAAFAADGSRLLVVDPGRGDIAVVDISSGTRNSIVNALHAAREVVVDPVAGGIYVSGTRFEEFVYDETGQFISGGYIPYIAAFSPVTGDLRDITEFEGASMGFLSPRVAGGVYTTRYDSDTGETELGWIDANTGAFTRIGGLFVPPYGLGRFAVDVNETTAYAWTGDAHPSQPFVLVAIDLATGTQRLLMRSADGGYDVVLSRDGRFLLASQNDSNGAVTRIMRIELPDGVITNTVGFERLAAHVLQHLDLSASGTYVHAYLDLDSMPRTLARIDLETGNVEPLVRGPDFFNSFDFLNTAGGPDVTSTPVDATTGTSPVTVTFTEVSFPGDTTLTTSPTGPELPAGFLFGNPATWYDLHTSATFDDIVTICISYAGVAHANESTLKLLHYEQGAWANVTTFLDVDNDLIYGEVTSFSPFAVVEYTGPVADAGPDRSISAAQTIQLDGRGSYDDDTATEYLTWSWSIVSAPSGSTAALVDTDTALPSFVADVPGIYEVSLVVTDHDGLLSDPDRVVISWVNQPPTADAGSDVARIVGEIVQLSGAASFDPDDDTLTYAWTVLSKPTRSFAPLTDATSVSPSFTPDKKGTYVIQLVVDDGFGPSAPDTVVITVVTPVWYAESVVLDVIRAAAALPTSAFTNRGNKKSFEVALHDVAKALQKDKLKQARKQLEDVIERTDGWTLRGRADTSGSGRDWVTDPAVSVAFYTSLQSALDAIEPDQEVGHYHDDDHDDHDDCHDDHDD